MKRIVTLLLILLLCLPLACASKPKTEAEPAPAVTAPAEQEAVLKLPFGARDGVAKTFPAYTAGFQTTTGEPLTFTAVSSDPAVAEAVLKGDGTLYVIAHSVGEAKITVTATTPSGEQAASVVSVKVSDARRTVALILLGVLAVVLLTLLGRPAAKKPAQDAPDTPEKPEEAPKEPAAIFEEEPNENPERS